MTRPYTWIDTRCGDNVVRVGSFHQAPDRHVRRPRAEPCTVIILPVVTIEKADAIVAAAGGIRNSHDRGYA